MKQLDNIMTWLHRVIGTPPTGDLADGQLLERFTTQHDETAFEGLLARHGPLVLGVCRRVLADAHEADDAFQATFLVLVRKAASLRKRGSLASWLFTVAYHIALKVRGDAARRREVETRSAAMSPREATGAGVWCDLRPVLDEELHRLPQKYQAPILLCYLQGKTQEEAARELGWTKGTVSGRLARARELLRGRLSRRGITLSAAGLGTVLAEHEATAVPFALGQSTLKAAVLVVKGATVAAAASVSVAALVEGTLRHLSFARLKTAAAVLLVCCGVLAAAVTHHFAPRPLPEMSAATTTTPPAEPAPRPVLLVEASYPGASAEEVERLVTVNLEVALAGIRGLKTTISRSQFGLASIELHFDDATDYADARQEVIKRLSQAPALPPGVTPGLTPSRQMTVEVLRYAVTGPRDVLGNDIYTLSDLRALQEYILEREFRRLPEVAEVLTASGAVKRYEIHPDPERMKRYGITLGQLTNALANSNANVGGDHLTQGRTAQRVRGGVVIGGGKDPMERAFAMQTPQKAAAFLRAEDRKRLNAIRAIVITSVNNVPVRIDDIVDGGPLPFEEAPGRQGVIVGHRARLGRVSVDQAPAAAKKPWRSADDVVEGIILVRKNADVSAAQAKILARVKEINAAAGRLLPGVKIEPCPLGDRFYLCGSFPPNTGRVRAAELVQSARKFIRELGEVQACVAHIGAAIDGEPPPEESAELCVVLKPAREWLNAAGLDRPRTLPELMHAVRKGLERQLAGTLWSTSLTGAAETSPFSPARDELVVKVFGPDLAVLASVADKVKQTLGEIKGVAQVRLFSGSGPRDLKFVVDGEKCRRYGLKVADVTAFIRAVVDGELATQMSEGEKGYDIVVRLPFRKRGPEDSILEIPVDLINNNISQGMQPATSQTPWTGGSQAPATVGTSVPLFSSALPRLILKDLVTPMGADGRPDPKGPFLQPGAIKVYREQGRRFVAVKCRVQGRTATEAQKDAQDAIAALVQVPYRVQWVTREDP